MILMSSPWHFPLVLECLWIFPFLIGFVSIGRNTIDTNAFHLVGSLKFRTAIHTASLATMLLMLSIFQIRPDFSARPVAIPNISDKKLSWGSRED